MLETCPKYDFVRETVIPLKEVAYYELQIALRELSLTLDEINRVFKAAVEDAQRHNYERFYLVCPQLGISEATIPFSEFGKGQLLQTLKRYEHYIRPLGANVEIVYINPEVSPRETMVAKVFLSSDKSEDEWREQLNKTRDTLVHKIKERYHELVHGIYMDLKDKKDYIDMFLTMYQLEQALR